MRRIWHLCLARHVFIFQKLKLLPPHRPSSWRLHHSITPTEFSSFNWTNQVLSKVPVTPCSPSLCFSSVLLFLFVPFSMICKSRLTFDWPGRSSAIRWLRWHAWSCQLTGILARSSIGQLVSSCFSLLACLEGTMAASTSLPVVRLATLGANKIVGWCGVQLWGSCAGCCFWFGIIWYQLLPRPELSN